MLRRYFLICLAGLLAACTGDGRPQFGRFEYTGRDAVFEQSFDPSWQYLNPILSGFYPDPSVCRKGDDFYLVCSSFGYFPGIPIFHSRDLVNWKPLGYVLDRPSQLDLEGIRLSGGIYAPAIEYDARTDRFYLVSTSIDGIENFIVWADDPAGPWSDPVPILQGKGGIDPSLFFDDDGTVYLFQNNDAPNGNACWEGHRAIWAYEFDLERMQIVGDAHLIVDGGANPASHPVWIEGPHLYKIDGRYILIAAEGGTEARHSEVVFCGETPLGPFVPYAGNPILTQRDLDPARPDRITCTGHVDLIEDAAGQWWAFFLGCRPYGDDYLFNTGRETFLLPVEWRNGFPVILRPGEAVPTVVKKELIGPPAERLTGNFTWCDTFDDGPLDYFWNFIRTPHAVCWEKCSGTLRLELWPATLREKTNPSFIGMRQKNTSFTVSVRVKFIPANTGEVAALVCFQNEEHYLLAGITQHDGEPALVFERREGNSSSVRYASLPERMREQAVTLCCRGDGGTLSFYATDVLGHATPITLAEHEDACLLSTQLAGGFSGNYIGLYASSGHFFE